MSRPPVTNGLARCRRCRRRPPGVRSCERLPRVPPGARPTSGAHLQITGQAALIRPRSAAHVDGMTARSVGKPVTGEVSIMAKIDLGRVGAVVNSSLDRAPVAEAAEREAWASPRSGPRRAAGQPRPLAEVAGDRAGEVAPGILAVSRFDADGVLAVPGDGGRASGPARAGPGRGARAAALATLNAYPGPARRGRGLGRRAGAGRPGAADVRSGPASGRPAPSPCWSRRSTWPRPAAGWATAAPWPCSSSWCWTPTRCGRWDTARAGSLGFLGRAPQYQASFARMGFTGDEIDGLADRLVDGLAAAIDRVVARGRAVRHGRRPRGPLARRRPRRRMAAAGGGAGAARLSGPTGTRWRSSLGWPMGRSGAERPDGLTAGSRSRPSARKQRRPRRCRGSSA